MDIRLCLAAGDAHHVMAAALDQLADVHGDDRLVLDHHDVGRSHCEQRATRCFQHPVRLAHAHTNRQRGIRQGQVLQRRKQEELPLLRGDVFARAVGHEPADTREEGDRAWHLRWQASAQRLRHQRVATRLAPREGAGVAPREGQGAKQLPLRDSTHP
jgi:hypothetical protein